MKLTPEQKEHFREAYRASAIIGDTWQLFCQFLQAGFRPSEALQQARDAMDVWVEYEDAAAVEPPEIERPDFPEAISDAMKQMFATIPKPSQLAWTGPLIPASNDANANPVDAEFIEPPKGEL